MTSSTGIARALLRHAGGRIARCAIATVAAAVMAGAIVPSVRAYASPAGQAPGRFETVHFPGSVATFAAGVDHHGLVVGYYYNQDGVRHGFTLQHGAYSALPDDPNAGHARDASVDQGTLPYSAVDVSDGAGAGFRLVIVGWYFDRAGSAHGFLYSQGNYFTIDVPGAGSAGTFVYGTDAAGAIVGQYYDKANVTHGFVYRNARFTIVDDPHAGVGSGEGTSLDAISPDGTIAGDYYDHHAVDHGFTYRNGMFTEINDPRAGTASGEGTAAFAINDKGVVGGPYTDASGTAHGFILAHGSYITFDVPGALDTEVLGLNDAGVVVGASAGSDGDVRGFIYRP